MDYTDKLILSILQKEGRSTCEALSKKTNLSLSAINERIKKLEKQKVIAGWSVRIFPQKIGLEVCAFVYLLLQERCEESNFLAEIAKIPQVLECHHITGEWSYLLKVLSKNIEHLEKLLNEKIKPVSGVVRTHTQIALSSPLDRSHLSMGAIDGP